MFDTYMKMYDKYKSIVDRLRPIKNFYKGLKIDVNYEAVKAKIKYRKFKNAKTEYVQVISRDVQDELLSLNYMFQDY